MQSFEMLSLLIITSNLQTAADFVNTINTTCGPCRMALFALGSYTACTNATDVNTLCMGTCRGLYDDIINSCNANVSKQIIIIM